MNKNTLINVLFEKSVQKQLNRTSRLTNSQEKDKIHQIFGFPTQPKLKNVNPSNKIIKITQFNSSLLVTEEKLYQKTAKSVSNVTPQKNFTIKKMTQFKSKTSGNSYRSVNIELKKKNNQNKITEKMYHADKKCNGYFLIDDNQEKQITKIMLTSKWSGENQAFGIQHLNNPSVFFQEPVNLIRQNEQKILKKSGEQTPLESLETDKTLPIQLISEKHEELFNKKLSKMTKFSSMKIETITMSNFDKDFNERKYSASPRKQNKRLKQQKKYQQNIEKEKRQILQMRKQLNKNYAKPFIPPEGVTAFSYIIYEADIKRNKKIVKKMSLQDYEFIQEGNQTKKIFLHSHQIIAAANSKSMVQIASLTKIMTCIVCLDICKSMSIDFTEQFLKIGVFEENIGGTSANIKKGQIYSLEQMLYGLMLPSGNDASLAIAVWGGRVLLSKEALKKQFECFSSIQSQQQRIKYKKKDAYWRFIQEMNTKAKQLDMQKTKYANSHGLSNSENKSCAFDLAILCEYAINNPTFSQIVSSKSYSAEISISNDHFTNQLRITRESTKSIKKSDCSNLIEDYCENEQMKDFELELKDNGSEMNFEDEGTSEGQVETKASLKTIRWYIFCYDRENTHQFVQERASLYVGIKTGITTTAGPCLSSCIEINSRRFLIIVLNSKSMKQRYKDTELLRKWLFTKEAITLQDKSKIIQNQDTDHS